MTTQGTNGRYPNISDHGLIGDLQTAALVTSDGTIDWFCCPRFDSPSVFASLLDADKGGYFRIAPGRRRLRHQAAVLPGHRDADHPVHDARRRRRGAGLHAGHRGRAHRPAPDRPHLRVARGTMQFAARHPAPVRLRPRQAHRSRSPRAARSSASDDGMELTLHTAAHGERRATARPAVVEQVGDGLRATFTMREGQTGGGVVLESMGGQPQRPAAGRARRAWPTTPPRSGGPGWTSSTYTGRWREMVTRSAMTLKLLTYAADRRAGRRRHARACPSRPAASATGTTASPGSATGP